MSVQSAGDQRCIHYTASYIDTRPVQKALDDTVNAGLHRRQKTAPSRHFFFFLATVTHFLSRINLLLYRYVIIAIQAVFGPSTSKDA
jgi:hypothetical protein